MKLSRNFIIVSVIVLNIALDQISKIIVRSTIAYREVVEIIGDNFILTNVENTGAFLGMGSELSTTMKTIFLLILPVVVLGYVVYYIIKTKSLDKLSLIAFCCIVGGGIANVFDRIVYGSVTDFLFIDLGGVFRTGIFNLADLSVTTGMLILIYFSIFPKKNTAQTSND